MERLVDAVIKHRRVLVILKWHKKDEDANKRERDAAELKKKENGEMDLREGRERGRGESDWGLGGGGSSGEWGEGARLHFRLRSAELKGGPCTNETQFHATLSLPVLFPGFHFH